MTTCAPIWSTALRYRLADLDPPPTAVVANLAYNIAVPLLMRTIAVLPGVERWAVMLQRELAERLFAVPRTKAYSAVSVLVQLSCEFEASRPVPRTVFAPPPRVDSAFVTFTRSRVWPADDAFVLDTLVRTSFAQRRKQIVNSLSGATMRGADAAYPRPGASRARSAWSARHDPPRGALAADLRGAGPRARLPADAVNPAGPPVTGAEGSGAAPRPGALVEVAAPAKINLSLLVGPGRSDGFHEIFSAMLPVTLADLVTARPAPPGAGLTVECPVAARRGQPRRQDGA